MNRPARIASSAMFSGFTAPEFLHMVDAGAFADLHVELVAGEIVKMMPSYLAHGEASIRLGAKLLMAFGGSARVAVDLMIAVSPDTIRAADIAVVRSTAERNGPVDPADVLLVVEIAGATLAGDLGQKLEDYLVAGIDRYWVVDPDGGVVHAMAGATGGDSYDVRQVVRFGEPIPVPGTDATIVID